MMTTPSHSTQPHRGSQVSPWLRRWFVVHFVADVVIAVPLMVAPGWLLGLLGWTVVDPFAARLVAAALFGIGIESLLGRSAEASAFRVMLELKIIWSMTAVVGMVVSLLEGAPPAGWIFVGIFAAFSGLWWYYRLSLGRPRTPASA